MHDEFVFNSSLNIVTCSGYDSTMEKLLQDPNILVTAMNKMRLNGREKGRTDSLCKFKSLLGRYFDKGIKVASVPNNSDSDNNEKILIKRGSIVSIDGIISRKFMVTVVWKATSSKSPKYWPSSDTPEWNIGSISHGTKYRLGVREVNVEEGTLSYMSYGGDDGLHDGKNVRKCYRLVTSIERVTVVYGSI